MFYVVETIDYIIKKIYENKIVKPMCKIKLFFCRCLDKLTKDYVFSVNEKQVRQNECCPMDAGISVIMSGIDIKRMEKDCGGT